MGRGGVKEPHTRGAPALQAVRPFVLEAEIARGAIKPAAATGLDLGHHIGFPYERAGQADEVAGSLGQDPLDGLGGADPAHQQQR